MEYSDKELNIINKIKSFCSNNKIRVDKVLAITMQINKTGTYFSVVIDFVNNKILQNYPIEFLDDYKEIKLNSVIICYKDDLALLNSKTSNLIKYDFPCCLNLKPYKEKKLEKDYIFKALELKQGSQNDIIYEIIEQVDNGPIISQKYLKLINSYLENANVDECKSKIHSFKNYKCTTHQRFFMVNLYSTIENDFNFHHMRLNPVTNLNNFESVFNLVPEENVKVRQ